MLNRKTELIEKPVRIQTFTNLHSIHTVSSISTDRKNNDSFEKTPDSSFSQNNKPVQREFVAQRFPDVQQVQPIQILPDNSNEQKIASDLKTQTESEYTDDDKELSNINLKKFKIDDFELGMKLGKGIFGNVYLAREKATNYIVALKILNKMEVQRLNGEKLIVREIKIHSFVDHPNIIKLYGFFHDDQNIYLILEYAPDGEVYTELKKSVCSKAQRPFYGGKNSAICPPDFKSLYLFTRQPNNSSGFKTGKYSELHGIFMREALN